MTSQTCLVSVVIPAFNRSDTISKAIDSVLRQDVGDFKIEILAIDDGSTDDTYSKMIGLIEHDDRIHCLRHNWNRGAQAARNTGCRAANGSWIAFLDSDDEWLPQSLMSRLNMANKLGVEVIHSDCFVLLKDDKRVRFDVPNLAGHIYREILAHPGPVFPALLVKRQALERIGFLDERITAWQEWDTAIRLARHYEFGFVPEPTFIYDCRGQDTISKNLLRGARGYEQIVKKHGLAILMNLGPLALSRHYQVIANQYHSAGDLKNTQRCQRLSFLWRLPRPRAALYRLKTLLMAR